MEFHFISALYFCSKFRYNFSIYGHNSSHDKIISFTT